MAGLSLGVTPLDNSPLPTLPSPVSGPAPLAGANLGAPPGGGVPPSGVAPQPTPPQLQMPPVQLPPSAQAARQGLSNAAGMEGNRFYRAAASLAGENPYAHTQALANFDLQQQNMAVQQQQMAMATMQHAMNSIVQFSALDPQTQATLAPSFTKMIRSSMASVGQDIPPELLGALATNNNAAQSAYEMFFKDRAWGEDEKAQHFQVIRKMKPDQVYPYFQKVEADKVTQMLPFVSQAIQNAVQSYRLENKIGVGALVPVEAVTQKINSTVPGFAQSQLAQRALYEALYGKDATERTKQWGIGLDKDAMQQMAKWDLDKFVGTGSRVGYTQEHPTWIKATEDLTKQLGRPPLPSEVWFGIPANDRQAMMVDVNKKANEEYARGRYTVDMEKVVTPKDLNDHFLNSELQKGNFTSPPAGITYGQLNLVASNATEKQKDAIRGIRESESILDRLDTSSARLIRATNAVDAIKQGAELWAGAKSGSNPFAREYSGLVGAFSGPLARSISSERGVLTSEDINRIQGALTSFTDTQASRALKIQAVREIVALNKVALAEEISGRSFPELRDKYRSKYDELIKKIDLATVIPPDRQHISKGNTVYTIERKYAKEYEAKGWTLH